MLGADVLDGYYGTRVTARLVTIATLAERVGLPTTVSGFSVSDRITADAARHLRTIPSSIRLWARDPAAVKRARDLGLQGVRLCADSAFLMEPARQPLRAPIRSQAHDAPLRIGVNANAIVGRWIGMESADEFVRVLAASILRLDERGVYSWQLLPHDFRSDDSDDACLERLFALLPPHVRARTRTTRPTSAMHAKAICSELDFVVTGRMHLAIASLGTGTPAACMDYQGKVAGLLDRMELRDLLIDARTTRDPTALSDRIADLINRRAELGSRIETALPGMRDSALNPYRSSP